MIFGYLVGLAGRALDITSENVGGTLGLFVVFTALTLVTLAVVGRKISSQLPDAVIA